MQGHNNLKIVTKLYHQWPLQEGFHPLLVEEEEKLQCYGIGEVLFILYSSLNLWVSRQLVLFCMDNYSSLSLLFITIEYLSFQAEKPKGYHMSCWLNEYSKAIQLSSLPSFFFPSRSFQVFFLCFFKFQQTMLEVFYSLIVVVDKKGEKMLSIFLTTLLPPESIKFFFWSLISFSDPFLEIRPGFLAGVPLTPSLALNPKMTGISTSFFLPSFSFGSSAVATTLGRVCSTEILKKPQVSCRKTRN